MKGKYSGRHMTVYGYTLPGVRSIARSSSLTENLTERARFKVKVLDWHKAHRNNTSLTARHFGLGRATVHRWIKQFKGNGLCGLNEKSRCPKRTRIPTVSPNTVLRIVQIRKQYPAWPKYKIRAVLKREGIIVSDSTVGRVLKRRGLINKKVSQRRRKAALKPKMRFPKGLRITEEGDLVQMDVKHIMLPGGKRHYQFTAIDVLGKRRCLRAYSSESSRNGALFLRECLDSFPFEIKRIQTDNGSTFLREFDKLCKELNIPHYYIHPRKPKENTYVEISHGADEREFYQQGNKHILLSAMQRELKKWEDIWNNFRPHGALGQLTPAEYSLRLKTINLPTKNVIILQV